MENLLSDRRIIQTVSLRLDLLYFIGYELDEPLPWHSAISRTRQLFGEEVFRQLFVQVLRQCVQKGMVKGKRQAMDSVHVKANASMNSLKEKEIVEDGEAYTNELSEEENEGEDNGALRTVSARKHQEVEWHHQWKDKTYKGQPGSRDERSKFISNHTHYSTTDPDARVAVKPGWAKAVELPRPAQYRYGFSCDYLHPGRLRQQKRLAAPAFTASKHENNLIAVGLKMKEALTDAPATPLPRP